MKTITNTLFAALLATASVCGQSAPPAKPPAHKATTRTEPRPSLLNPASLNRKAPDVFKAKFTTTKGDFVVEVTRAWAPLGADRFYNLVRYHFYDGASLFRIVPGFVAQFGIPTKPAIAKVWTNANIQDDPVTQSNLQGYVTFAQTGSPNSRNTQVFINYGDNSRLDHMQQGFAPFGKVVEGFDVVEKFYSGYGDRGPDQGRLTSEGKAYVDKEFPQLDSIKTAVIVAPAPAAAAPKTAAKPTTPAAKPGT
jgi:cyclophilin family peptidyl-prolyl cis-trans isomerase